MFYTIYDSPIGAITLVADEHGLSQLHLEEDRYFGGVDSSWIKDGAQPILLQAKQQLGEYFAGERTAFDVPLSQQGTDFQKQVWDYLRNITQGQTVSYGDIAKHIGKPAAVRAVGTAVGRNPICVIVPCHRVLAGDKTLAGYVAGIDRKKFLLDLEKAVYKA